MKGATLRATLERLGVTSSYRRPSVSNDNPYSESLFRTLKYRPEYPGDAFASIVAAERWVTDFFSWYNTEHRRSAIRFLTPDERHSVRDLEILARRRETVASPFSVMAAGGAREGVLRLSSSSAGRGRRIEAQRRPGVSAGIHE